MVSLNLILATQVAASATLVTSGAGSVPPSDSAPAAASSAPNTPSSSAPPAAHHLLSDFDQIFTLNPLSGEWQGLALVTPRID